MRIIYEDLRKLREDVTRLVNEDKVEIWWWHIKPIHGIIRRHEIISTLLYGAPLRSDKEIEGRYVIWSRFTEDGRLLRVVFQVKKVNGTRVVVVTAFEEE